MLDVSTLCVSLRAAYAVSEALPVLPHVAAWHSCRAPRTCSPEQARTEEHLHDPQETHQREREAEG